MATQDIRTITAFISDGLTDVFVIDYAVNSARDESLVEFGYELLVHSGVADDEEDDSAAE